MVSLSKYLVIGLILLNSTHAFAQDAASALVEPPNAPPKDAISYDPADITNAAARFLDPVAQINAEGQDIIGHVNKEAAEVKVAAKDYAKDQKACKSRENITSTVCMESRNPEVKKYLMFGQVLMAGVSGMMDACSKVGQLMDAGNKLLTAYQAACSSARGLCMSVCGSAKKNAELAKNRAKDLITKASTHAEKQANAYESTNPTKAQNYRLAMEDIRKKKESFDQKVDLELTPKGNHMSVADKVATCDGYARELASAAVGLLGMAISHSKANNCEENTSNTALTTPTPVDCTIAENKQNNMTCICQDAPRTPGCSTGLDSTVAAKNAESMRAASTSDYTPTTAGKNSGAGLDGGSNGGMDLASKSGDSGSSAPGAPMGGGGAGLDGGGGFGGSADKAAAQKAAGLNTNILGGEGGGGGGGGGWGRGGGADDGLRQYLPGGAKDPAIGVAGQAAISKEVTSQGGKSNWEKVRDRYRDNKPRLLEP